MSCFLASLILYVISQLCNVCLTVLNKPPPPKKKKKVVEFDLGGKKTGHLQM